MPQLIFIKTIKVKATYEILEAHTTDLASMLFYECKRLEFNNKKNTTGDLVRLAGYFGCFPKAFLSLLPLLARGGKKTGNMETQKQQEIFVKTP